MTLTNDGWCIYQKDNRGATHVCCDFNEGEGGTNEYNICIYKIKKDVIIDVKELNKVWETDNFFVKKVRVVPI